MPTLVLDVDLDDPRPESVELGPYGAARLLHWIGAVAVGQTTAFGPGPLMLPALAAEARLAFAAQVAAARARRDAPPPPRLPSVCVVIATRNRAGELAGCLDSLGAQVDAPEHEVVVADNAPSDDATRRLVESRPPVRYVREDLPGQNFGRNAGLAAARSEVVAFLDDDMRPVPTWMRACAELFARHPDVDAGGGPVPPAELETEAQELCERAGGFAQQFTFAVFGPEPPPQADDVTAASWPCWAGFELSGGNMAFRAAVLRRIGGFDEALDTQGLPGGGDTDAFYRLLRGGGRFARDPAMVARHRHVRDMVALRLQLSDSWGAGNMAYLRKWLDKETDAMRPRVRRAIRATFAYHVARLWGGPAARASLPAAIELAQLRGCLRGLFAYERSRARAERLRAGALNPR